jgi:hypothetical protein
LFSNVRNSKICNLQSLAALADYSDMNFHVTIQETHDDFDDVRYPNDAVRTNEGRYGEIGDGAVQPPWFLEAIRMEGTGSYL